MKKCIICGSDNTIVIYKKYQGYVVDTYFDIYRCINCESHFTITDDSALSLYDLIYSSNNTWGYDRYYNYAINIKSKRNPLRYLAENEPTYYPLYKYLKDKKELKILEIGCGYGYTSYALKKMGFDITGTDISPKAVAFAKKNFGDYFLNCDINELAIKSEIKYNLIIATEVIEHLQDPLQFINACLKLLEKDGIILLTTPDKDYSKQTDIWQTDLPPVHLSWLGKKSIITLGNKIGLECVFFDYTTYYPKTENRLVKYFRTRRVIIPEPIFSKTGETLKRNEPSKTHKVISFIVHKIAIIRMLSNIIYNIINGSEITLAVILKRK